MDGTIVNSIFGIMHSMNNVLSQGTGLNSINVDQCKSFVGNGIKELVRKVAGINSPDDPLLEQYYRDMLEEYSKNWDYGCMSTTVLELLDFLAQKNI